MTKKMKEFIGVGRRKTAVASVRMRIGKGKYDVNGKNFEEYFTSDMHRRAIEAPLQKLKLQRHYDIIVRVRGGGLEAQKEAVRLGISRALVSESEDRRQDLKEEGFLTRDPRKKERKKYGLRGARKAFQFSKR